MDAYRDQGFMGRPINPRVDSLGDHDPGIAYFDVDLSVQREAGLSI